MRKGGPTKNLRCEFELTKQFSPSCQDRIRAKDPTLPWNVDKIVFRCGRCFTYKFPFRFDMYQRQRPVEKRRCLSCLKTERAAEEMLHFEAQTRAQLEAEERVRQLSKK